MTTEIETLKQGYEQRKQEYERAVMLRMEAEVNERMAWNALREAGSALPDDRNPSLRSGSPV